MSHILTGSAAHRASHSACSSSLSDRVDASEAGRRQGSWSRQSLATAQNAAQRSSPYAGAPSSDGPRDRTVTDEGMGDR